MASKMRAICSGSKTKIHISHIFGTIFASTCLEFTEIPMQERSSSARPLPGLVPLILLCGVLAASWIVTPDSHSQAPSAPSINSEALATLVAKLKSQQDVMVANQTKIETQTALLKEQVRQAKIFAARIR
jgi:hypothetical protein